jgi:hypothetical protein
LKLGDRVVFERASGNERIRVHTPAGVALFSVVHIFDIYAIVR